MELRHKEQLLSWSLGRFELTEKDSALKIKKTTYHSFDLTDIAQSEYLNRNKTLLHVFLTGMCIMPTCPFKLLFLYIFFSLFFTKEKKRKMAVRTVKSPT